ncbi:hypothetical protein, partial [Planococcus wigleyi]
MYINLKQVPEIRMKLKDLGVKLTNEVEERIFLHVDKKNNKVYFNLIGMTLKDFESDSLIVRKFFEVVDQETLLKSLFKTRSEVDIYIDKNPFLRNTSFIRDFGYSINAERDRGNYIKIYEENYVYCSYVSYPKKMKENRTLYESY